MRIGFVACFAFAALSACPALAECTISSDADAVVRSLTATSQADVNLIMSMSILPKLAHLNYASAARKSACDIGSFTAGDTGYELWGKDGTGRERKAIPNTKDRPIALVMPVIDILKALQVPKDHQPTPTEGYLLATIAKDQFTGWRFYTGMPDQTVLKHDMAEALAGSGTPIFRNDSDGKTHIFVPAS